MRYRYIFKDRRDYENTMLLLAMFGAGAVVAGIAVAILMGAIMNVPMRTFSHLGTFTGQHYTPPEPAVSLPQAILAGLSLALFVCGGLLLAVALTA